MKTITIKVSNINEAFHGFNVVRRERGRGWQPVCGYSFSSIDDAKAWLARQTFKNVGEIRISNRVPAHIGGGVFTVHPECLVV